MFARVLIANRGEIVLRVARTLRRLGIAAIAIHERDDAGAQHVSAADVAVAVRSYRDAEAVIEAALRSGADAIHPGYGFLSERVELAQLCEQHGVVWIGPPPAAIAMMGDKAAAKAFAAQAGVPILPGLHGDAATPGALRDFAAATPLPLVIKAVAGGGGKGMRIVRRLEDVESAIESAQREAESAFGAGGVLIERFVEPARHIEVQVLADRHGNVAHLGERECSLQRRAQKVIEEAPSPVVDAELRRRFGEEAIRLAAACGYVGVGTVEFVAAAHDPGDHCFIEMNTRLQVEHPVTEEVWGVDLVECQLRVAAGERLPDLPEEPRGHAIEARVYAEDPANGFLPATGRIESLRMPRGTGIRLESGIAEGDVVGTRYDPMLAKVIASGGTRAEALGRLRAALCDVGVVGLRTNTGFLRALLDNPAVETGDIDTGLIERQQWVPPGPGPAEAAAAAVVAAALWRAETRPQGVFAALGGWRLHGDAVVTRRLRIDGGAPLRLEMRGPLHDGQVSVDGTAHRVAGRRLGDGRVLLWFDGEARAWSAECGADGWWLECAGVQFRVVAASGTGQRESGGDTRLLAPMPGQVVQVRVAEGVAVSAGDVLLVMESMKMEMPIVAPVDGTVAALDVVVGDVVALDQELAVVHPATAEVAT